MIAKPLLRASQACFLDKARKPPLLCHAASEKEKKSICETKSSLKEKKNTHTNTHTHIYSTSGQSLVTKSKLSSK